MAIHDKLVSGYKKSPWSKKYVYFETWSVHASCADPEGGTGGPDPHLEFENFTLKKGNFGIFFWGGGGGGGVGAPLTCDQKLPFSLDPLS